MRAAPIFMAVALSATAASAHEEALTYDRIDLRVSAEEAVDNDTLVVSLYAERRPCPVGASPARSADRVSWSLAAARPARINGTGLARLPSSSTRHAARPRLGSSRITSSEGATRSGLPVAVLAGIVR